MAPKPNLALIILPCLLGAFMATCGLHDFAILSTKNQEIISLYFNSKPFFIISQVQAVVPALVGIKVLLVLRDVFAIIRCRATLSNYMGLVFLITLGAIATQFLPMKQVEVKLLNGTATNTDIEKGIELTSRILIGNVAMIIVNIITYVVNVREFKNKKINDKTKKE